MKHHLRLSILFCLTTFYITTAQNQAIQTTLNQKQAAQIAEEVSSLGALFHEKAVIYNFPKEEIAKGKTEISGYFENIFDETEILDISKTGSISFKGYIIEKEIVKTSNGIKERVIIYKFRKNQIKSMTILEKLEVSDTFDPTLIVDQQLRAYNNRDIDAFVNTYSKNAALYIFPNRTQSSGQAGLKNDYSDFFKNTPNLHCQIENRIVLGNLVIDKELVTSNSNTFGAIAIYAIENGLISKVTFIQ